MDKPHFLTSDHVKLHVEIIGDPDKPLMVWNHGFTGSARNWRSTIRKLTDYRHLIFDMRGHARSEAPTVAQSYTLARLGQDICELVEHFGQGQKCTGVGLSLGSMALFQAVIAKPALFDKVVFSSLPNPTADKGLTCNGAKFANAILHQGMEQAGEMYVWGPASGLSPQDAQLVKLGFLEHPAYAMAMLLQHVLTQLPFAVSFADDLARSQVPALLLYGEHDSAAEHFSQAIFNANNQPRQTYTTLEIASILRGGHLLNITSATAFITHIELFLKK